jgi:TonB family protein
MVAGGEKEVNFMGDHI